MSIVVFIIFYVKFASSTIVLFFYPSHNKSLGTFSCWVSTESLLERRFDRMKTKTFIIKTLKLVAIILFLVLFIILAIKNDT